MAFENVAPCKSSQKKNPTFADYFLATQYFGVLLSANGYIANNLRKTNVRESRTVITKFALQQHTFARWALRRGGFHHLIGDRI